MFATRVSGRFGVGSVGCVQQCFRGVRKLSSVADGYSNFIFDCDGVLWNASTLIDGSREAIHSLKSAGKRCVFVTNNATKSRTTYVEKFQTLGFEGIEEFDINTSASASAEHCSKQKYKRAFVIGEIGLRQELELQGIEVVWDKGCRGMGDADFLEVVENIKSGPPVDVVVVGWDKNFSYRKLCIASVHLQRGAKLVVTNPDSADRMGEYLMPGNGCNAAAILCSMEGSTKSTNCGKPSQDLMDALLLKYGFKEEETLMCGDRLDTDIEFGGGRVDTLLVLSGVSTSAHLTKLPSTATRPQHVAANLHEALITITT